MSAGARTDDDPSVVVATLESIELILKSLKECGFHLEEKVVSSLLVTIEDILNNKVSRCGFYYYMYHYVLIISILIYIVQ